MKLTDEQKRILVEAADIFSEAGDEEIFYAHEDSVTGDRLADKIVEFIVTSGYDYDSPIGPITSLEALRQYSEAQIRREVIAAVMARLKTSAQIVSRIALAAQNQATIYRIENQ